MSADKGDHSWLIKELSEYIFYGSSLMQQLGTIGHVAEMVSRNLHHTVYIREEGRVVGVAIYMMLTTSTLHKIASGELNLKDSDTFKRLEKENGDNMHIFTIRSDRMGIILKGTKDVIKNLKPRTISWFKDNELKNMRFLKCHKF